MRTTPLQVLYSPTDRKAWRDRHQQMYMVPVYTACVDRHFMRDRRLSDQLSATLADITAEHLVTILRDPHEMILTVPNRVTAALVRFHSAILHGNLRNPMPPKGVGFPDPLSGTVKFSYAHRFPDEALTERRWCQRRCANLRAEHPPLPVKALWLVFAPPLTVALNQLFR